MLAIKTLWFEGMISPQMLNSQGQTPTCLFLTLPSIFSMPVHFLHWLLTHCFFYISAAITVLWFQTSCRPRALGCSLSPSILESPPTLLFRCWAPGWGSSMASAFHSPSNLRLLAVGLSIPSFEQRMFPLPERWTSPGSQVSTPPRTDPAFLSFMLSPHPLPLGRGSRC